MALSKFRGLAVAAVLAFLQWRGYAATGTIQDVQHVVILMQENRSFDHACGLMGGVRGFGDRNPMLFNNGESDFYQSDTNGNYVLPYPIVSPCVNDLDHGFPSGVDDWDVGKWDQWIPAKGTETMAYFPTNFLVLHQALANAFTICDNYFCSLIGPTYPNRLYLFTGMIDPNGTGGGPAWYNYVPPDGFTWSTYPEALQAAGVSWRVYRPEGDNFGDALPWFANFMNAQPGTPLYDRGVAEVPDVVAALASDVTNGTLPEVSWIIPTYGSSAHPPYSPETGENFIENVLNTLALNPAVLNSTVFILTYDEGGGFFDHVLSPASPWNTPNESLSGVPLGPGIRVPTFVISPWSRGGHVCSQVFDHTSILRFLEDWTGVMETNISAWRRQVCGDLTSAFDFTNPVTNSWPVLPYIAPAYQTPYQPVPPTNQALPFQATNTLLSVPLPYQPEVTAQTSCGSQQIQLTFTNGGTASVHFAVYANPVAYTGPVQYDVAAGASGALSFAVSGTYNFTCYGPNGFQRQYAGNLAADCQQIECASTVNTNNGLINLAEQNNTAAPVTFIVTDSYGLAGSMTNTVQPATVGRNTFSAVALNNGWYDLIVTASSDPSFMRHYTGHIENGSLMASEPVVLPSSKGTAPGSPTAPGTAPVTLSNAPSVLNLMAALPTVPASNSLPIYAAGFSTNLALIYPGWASNCTVLTSSTMAPGSWAPTNLVLTNIGNYTVAVLPSSASAMFFRLHQ